MASRKILFLFLVSLFPLFSLAKIQIGRVVAASNGSCNGSIEVLLSGSLGPFTLTLAGNSAQSVSNITENYTFNNLCTGSYTLTVSGTNPSTSGCQSSFNIFVDDLACHGFTIHTEEIIDATDCAIEDGGIALTIENDDLVGFSYEVSNGQSGSSDGVSDLYFTINRLAASNYNVTITGDNGCVEVYSFEIGPSSCNTACSEPIVLTTVATPVFCSVAGFSNGSIDLTVDGGQSPYDFYWENTTGDDYVQEDLANLEVAGIYFVTVTDANGCQAETSALVEMETAFSLEPDDHSDASDCQSNDGFYLIYIESSDQDYQNHFYSYEVSDGQFGDDLQSDGSGYAELYIYNLYAGEYTLTVTDEGSCSRTLSFEIGPSSCEVECPLNIKLASTTNSSCSEVADGNIQVYTIGGTLPYQYSWADDQNNPIGTSAPRLDYVAAGTYQVTVTDAANCSVSNTFIIGVEDPITLNTLTTNTTCGDNNGEIDLIVEGAPHFTYEYTWEHLESNTSYYTKDLDDLANGTYEVTVSYGDKGGCEAFASATIGTSNNPLNISMSRSKTGNCLSNPPTQGDITVSVSGGEIPYSYHFTNYADEDTRWDNTSSSVTFRDLNVGTYYVTATDASGCSQTSSFELVDDGDVMVAGAITNAICGDNSGAINLTVTGGVAPYAYEWESDQVLPIGAQGQQNITNLSPGIYTVTVTERADDPVAFFSCKRVKAFRVGSIENIAISHEVVGADCFGKGKIKVTVNQGVAPYTYRWREEGNFFWSSATSAESFYTIDDLSLGTYEVEVLDDAGCSSATTKTIEYANDILKIAEITPALPSCTEADGAVTVRIENGFPPFVYTITDNNSIDETINSNNPSETFANLPIGTYEITVTDDEGCEVIVIYELIDNSNLDINLNPTNPLCGNTNGELELTINYGNAPYDVDWAHLTGSDDGETSLTDLAPDTYEVTVRDANNCIRKAASTLVNVDDLRVSFSATNADCNGNGGSITMDVTSGSPQYIYYWKKVGTTNAWSQFGPTDNTEYTATALSSGSYEMKVSNDSGCEVNSSEIISNSSRPSATYDEVLHNCSSNGGTITIEVSGGTGNIIDYGYEWFKGSSNDVFSTGRTLDTDQGGKYRVVVIDAVGCRSTEPSDKRTLYNAFRVSPTCTWQTNQHHYDLNANKSGGSSGGVSGIQYSWSGPESVPDQGNVNPTESGYYTVTATDPTTGCTAISSASCSGGNAKPANNHLLKKTDEPFISIYPNPFNATFNIDITTTIEQSITIHLYDLMGRRLHSQSLDAQVGLNQTQIDLSTKAISSGVYQVVVSGKDMSPQNFKVVRVE